MKLNENYILKNIAGTAVVVPVGDAVNDIKGMITLNGPAEIIWKGLQNGKNIESIVEEIKSEYDASEDVIKNDVDAFLNKLRTYKILVD
ncbi:MAG: PqqD family protein [Clostridia bacterium]|nr:PqqD family protein [Clostridia bacterium]